jgi:arylsulfatase A-like enzyme
MVAANYTTIPEFFKDNGYYTVGMGKVSEAPSHLCLGVGCRTSDTVWVSDTALLTLLL